ncbi:hypothetical protein, partial [Pseudomonas sp. GM24]|uniref:hypothetical protein n=1 Tax=Pseudomonas sp. GM24 TaxID=1144326 RepID=UPI001EE653BA
GCDLLILSLLKANQKIAAFGSTYTGISDCIDGCRPVQVRPRVYCRVLRSLPHCGCHAMRSYVLFKQPWLF